ncbi:MAG: hypothetical protein AAGF76_06430 [Pseudomonadota bacterium]
MDLNRIDTMHALVNSRDNPCLFWNNLIKSYYFSEGFDQLLTGNDSQRPISAPTLDFLQGKDLPPRGVGQRIACSMEVAG